MRARERKNSCTSENIKLGIHPALLPADKNCLFDATIMQP